MIYEHEKFDFSRRKRKKEPRWKQYAPSFLVLASILILAGYFSARLFDKLTTVEHHGPNPNIRMSMISSEAASDEDTSLLDEGVPPVVSNILKPVDIQTLDPAKQIPVLEKKGGFGIAAGGSLTSLNQGDLDRYFDTLQALGVMWVRWDIDWNVIQREGVKSYHWEGTDRVAHTAEKYGIHSLGIITYAPRWAADKRCLTDAQCAPVDAKAFGHFAGEAALRYKSTITSWEIWNEPNFTLFWSPKPSAKKYADVLKEASTEIKKVDPTAIVLSGGLAPSADEKEGSISPTTFIKSLYASGANQYFDGIALHPYTFPVSPKYKAWWNSWQQMYGIRNLMIKNNESNKKIWVTEYGAPTGGPGKKRSLDHLEFIYDQDFVSESAQEGMAKDVIALYQKSADWMGGFFWYSLRDNGTKKNTPENFFGLLRYDGTKKPAYDDYKEAVSLSKITSFLPSTLWKK
jgi:hypothetical protein